jgi:IS5 family transposase
MLFAVRYSMKSYQVSFFDESQRLAALSRLKDPLEELGRHVDFEIFRPILTEALRNSERKSPAGRKPLDVVLMFKALIIQRLFNLSDEQLEFQITDRLSFTRFLGLYIGETIPDYSSFWRFREALVEKGLERELFEHFSAKLEVEGVFAKAGSIIDATIVEVPRQRNSREVNARIKAGEVPAEWDDNKRVHKDTDARWVKKNGVNYFGYKDHIKTDAGTSLITDYRVTVASTHDSVVLRELLSEADSGKSLHADGAYTGEEIEGILQELNIKNQVCEKGHRGAPLTETQRRHNRQKSKIRALVEHVFGFMENSMNGIFLRCIGLKRAKCQIGLANLTYNICRYAQLVRLNRVQCV